MPNNAQRQYFEREPAKRVFASELREVRVQFKGSEDEKSPSYVLLPTGERANRILIVGSMTEKQRRGDQNTFYTARISDPTGIFAVNAGNYQPDAMEQISRIEPPAFVAVVGKPNLYETPDGANRVSVRIESINEVDAETRMIWLLDTAEQTLERLDRIKDTPDGKSALEEYGSLPSSFRKVVYDALVQVKI